MDNLLREMVEAGKAEVVHYIPAIKQAGERIIYALTKPSKLNLAGLTREWLRDCHTAGAGVLKFPLYLFNGTRVINDGGGLN